MATGVAVEVAAQGAGAGALGGGAWWGLCCGGKALHRAQNTTGNVFFCGQAFQPWPGDTR